MTEEIINQPIEVVKRKRGRPLGSKNKVQKPKVPKPPKEKQPRKPRKTKIYPDRKLTKREQNIRYNMKHKEQIAQKKECDNCGAMITKNHLKEHKESIKCKNFGK